MPQGLLSLPIALPLLAGILTFLIPKRIYWGKEGLALLATLANLTLTLWFLGKEMIFSFLELGFGGRFSLRLDHFSAFILVASAAFAFAIAIYSTKFMQKQTGARQYYAYFLGASSFVNGAVLANNLLLLLFFWEGLLLFVFGLIAIGTSADSFATAKKAFIIVGITDLCLMLGIGLVGHLAGTLEISQINLLLTPLGTLAFLLLFIGAVSKAGSMPFHSWIPDASTSAPLPFMAFFPASLEKLLGIYFLARISLEMFQLQKDSGLSFLFMAIGALTILLAVMMALVQKNYKRLLSYHAISQVGYMILGIGTMVPAGIVGGLFHMLNNALYKSCLFLTAGAAEKQSGQTDLENLGGLRQRMPITFSCFMITAAAISGVPPFNGFFSKELIYDGCLERGWIFYLAALVGSFFTAASFLKLGHAAFFGQIKEENRNIKEAPFLMLAPMLILAFTCIIFGIFNFIPLRLFIQPILGEQRLAGCNFAGFPANTALVLISLLVLGAACLNHFYGWRRTGSPLKSVDHIHFAPVLAQVYAWAEKGYFDPYNIGLGVVKLIAYLGWGLDRFLDGIYEVVAVKVALGLGWGARKLQSGNYTHYLLWSLLATLSLVLFILKTS